MDVGYVWDEAKYQRVQEKHAVCFDEVVAVFEDEHELYLPDPQEHLGREMVVGKTRQGRILQSIFTYEDAPLIRIVTAFDASDGWRDKYVQK
jgi:uncharacterized DUF497 family protein